MTLYSRRRLLCSVGFAIGSFALAASSWAATIVDRQARPLNEIMIVVDSASGAWPDPATIIARVRENDSVLRTRLQSPVAARFLQPARIRPGVLAQFAANSRLKLLQQVIVVTYADRLSADRAEAMLLDDPGILLLERSMAMRFATGGPNDPLLAHHAESTKYQWAAERLQLIPAWDKVRGTAYAAVLDNGIQIHGLSTNPGIHPDLSANYRPQFSSNFGEFNGTPSNNGTPNSLTGYPNSASNLDEEPYTLDGYPNIAGHGSHTAGILAAQAGNSIGVAGVCQNCSLMAGRISSGEYNHPEAGVIPDSVAVNAGIGWMTNAGTQVINISFYSNAALMGCEMGNNPITCATLDAALELDVAIVAAAGNGRLPELQFPASYAGVIGVGGVQYDANGAAFWTGSSDFGSNWATDRPDYLVAPAKDVISTAYTGTDWRADSPYNCGDNLPAGFSTGYGDCTGTSMAAPHVSGIVALIRSAYPTASLALVKNILTTNTTPCVEAGTSNIDSTGVCGAGIPDASRAVTAALGGEQVINRLTPLFSFYSAQAEDHFYTVVPQMGNAALWGTLFPTREDGGADGFAAIGTTISGYPAFPGPACEFSPCPNRTAKALVSIFTTFRNPIPGGPELVPLYRYSWSCPEGTTCGSNADHVSHVYTTNPVGEAWESAGYLRDGIEGYVYPKSMSQPTGTVKLCRKYDPTRDDYVLFPGTGSGGTDCSASSDGYTGGNYADLPVTDANWIGWVYSSRTPMPICSGGGACAATPVLAIAVSRKTHGSVGDFALPLSLVSTNPTTEPRTSSGAKIVMTFDNPIASATVAVTEGAATINSVTVVGADVIVQLTGVGDAQYVTVSLTNVVSTSGGTGGSGSVRIGFLFGDVNGSRAVTAGDVAAVNAVIAQYVTGSNYLDDVNNSGTLTVADKGLVNAAVTHSLPSP